MWKWLQRAFVIAGIVFITAYHVLDEAGVPRRVTLCFGYAALGVVVLWTVAKVVRYIAVESGKPSPPGSSKADDPNRTT